MERLWNVLSGLNCFILAWSNANQIIFLWANESGNKSDHTSKTSAWFQSQEVSLQNHVVIFQNSNYSQTCIKHHHIKRSVVKVLKFVPHNYGNFHLFWAVIVTLDWLLTACLYCLPLVLNGHWKWEHSNRTKNNFSHKIKFILISWNKYFGSIIESIFVH